MIEIDKKGSFGVYVNVESLVSSHLLLPYQYYILLYIW